MFDKAKKVHQVNQYNLSVQKTIFFSYTFDREVIYKPGQACTVSNRMQKNIIILFKWFVRQPK